MLTVNGSSEISQIRINQINMPLQKSVEKKYFVGQSDDLAISASLNAWVELTNPNDSNINLHLAAWTTSNISGENYTVKIYFNSNFPDTLTTSTNITPTNLLEPLAESKASIRYVGNTSSVPSDGIEGFSRRVPSQATIGDEENGKFIIPPGKTFALFLTNGTLTLTIRGAFGWWEEPV